MNGILILAHGSNRHETENTLNELIKIVKQKTGIKLILPGYLQFCQPDLETGIAGLVANGATSIRVIPLFIFDGVHVTEDIPRELTAIRKKYPQLTIELSEHLGADERIADILVDRICNSA